MNFKNPWAKGGEYYPDWLGGEKVLEGNSISLHSSTPRTSKWFGSKEQVAALENKYRNFTKILKNLNKLPSLYPNLIDELHKCTGISKQQLLKDLNYNAGAEILVFENTPFDASATNATSITLNSKALDNYEKLTDEELKIATAMWVVTLIHEEVHRGDRKKNEGFISGQWSRKFQKGKDQNNFPIYEYEIDFNTTVPQGQQYYSYSLFGHRGTDIEILVFKCPGVITNQLDIYGRKTKWLIAQLSETNSASAGSGEFNMSEWGSQNAQMYKSDKLDQMADFTFRIGKDNAIQIANTVLL